MRPRASRRTAGPRGRCRRRCAPPAGPRRCWMRSIRSLRSHPDWVAGWVETITSSGRRLAIASIVARNGSASPTSPDAAMPSRGEQRHRQIDAHLRRFAHRLVVDHEARRGLASGARRAGSAVSPAAARSRTASSSFSPPSVRLATTRISRIIWFRSSRSFDCRRHARRRLRPGSGAGAKMPCTAPGTPYS